jgi:hypothetical protein
VTAFVPAVFGEEPITIVEAIGSLPEAPGMGWVFFQAGNPEFPVWVGAQEGGGGGGDGGGGTDEVWIGPEPPVSETLELWYDSDAPGIGLGTVSYMHTQAVAATVWSIDHNLGWFPNVMVLSGSDTLEGDISQTTVMRMTLTFSAAVSGIAYLS